MGAYFMMGGMRASEDEDGASSEQNGLRRRMREENYQVKYK